MPPPQSASSVLTRARELVEENRAADAAALLERTSTADTDALHREIALRGATQALEAPAIAAAVAWLERGLTRNPTDLELNCLRGRLHSDAGQPAAALACFRRAVTANPGHEEAALACASALLATGDAAEVPALLAAFPASARAQLALAEAALAGGQIAEARAACERARRLQPERFDAWQRLGEVCTQSDDRLGALLACTRAVALRPACAAAHAALGGALVRLGQPQQARQSYAACLRIDPGHAPARAALAQLGPPVSTPPAGPD